jgi:hypothetical protein
MDDITLRIARRNDDDVMYIADIIEREKTTEFWKLLASMTEGRRINEIEKSKASHVNFSAERILGRIEAYETLLDDLESFLDQADVLRQPLDDSSQRESSQAVEISSTSEISESGISYGGQV